MALKATQNLGTDPRLQSQRPKATAADAIMRFQHTVVLALCPVPEPQDVAAWQRKHHCLRKFPQKHW